MNLYCDYKNIYKFNSNGISIMFPIVADNDTLVITGTHVSVFEDDLDVLPVNSEFSFIDKRYNKNKIEFYCVPFVDIFGYDENGYYATFNDFTSENCESKIIYIDNFLNVYFVAKNFHVFCSALLNGCLIKHEFKTNDFMIYSSYFNAKNHLEKEGKLYIP